MNFYKHHIGDYAQATAHLSFVEDAAYSRLIRKYYAEEKPLPANIKAVQRLIGARTREEKQAVADILDEFFELQEDGWHNKRCDSELASNSELDDEREARAANERERQRRHREERKRLFESLRAYDIVPAWDTKTETLRKLLDDAAVTPPVTRDNNDKSRPVTPPVTRDNNDKSRPVTPPVTRTATANQTPDTRHQTPDKTSTPESRSNSPGADAPPAHGRTQIDPGFVPSQSNRHTALTHSLDIDSERERFVAHYIATGDYRANWHSQFQKWLLDSMQHQVNATKRAQAPPASGSSRQARVNNYAAQAAAARGNEDEQGHGTERCIDGEAQRVA